MPDPVACRECGTLVLWINDGRRRIPINASGMPVVTDLSFRIDDTAVRGWTREGSPIAGRKPREGEQPNSTIHLGHARTCTGAQRLTGRRLHG